MVGVLVGDDDVRYVQKFWVGYDSHRLEGRFENGDVVVFPFPGVYQDIRIVFSYEVGVRPYHSDIDEHLREVPVPQ